MLPLATFFLSGSCAASVWYFRHLAETLEPVRDEERGATKHAAIEAKIREIQKQQKEQAAAKAASKGAE